MKPVGGGVLVGGGVVDGVHKTHSQYAGSQSQRGSHILLMSLSVDVCKEH